MGQGRRRGGNTKEARGRHLRGAESQSGTIGGNMVRNGKREGLDSLSRKATDPFFRLRIQTRVSSCLDTPAGHS